MNLIFVLIFLLLLKLNKPVSLCCLLSMLAFYLPVNDFWLNGFSVVLMCLAIELAKNNSIKILLWLCAFGHLLSMLSNFYFDYSFTDNLQLNYVFYLVYLLFTQFMITIYALIAYKIVRSKKDGVFIITDMLGRFSSLNSESFRILRDDKSAKKNQTR